MPDFLLSEAIFVAFAIWWDGVNAMRGQETKQEHSPHVDFLLRCCDTRTHIQNWFLCITALKHFSLCRYTLFLSPLPHPDSILTTDRTMRKHITPTELECSVLSGWNPIFSFKFFFLFFCPDSINAGSVSDMWMSSKIQWQGKNGKERETTISVAVKLLWYKKLNRKKTALCNKNQN